MVIVQEVQVIRIGDDGNRWILTVNFEHKTVEIEGDAAPSVEPPDDVIQLRDEWQAFADEEGFTHMGVEHPEDAKKCVTPF